MAYKLTAKHLGLEKGALIEISAGIVAIPNGKSVVLTLEQEQAFFTKYGEYPDTYFERKDSGIFSCTVTKAKAVSSDNFHGQPVVAAVEDEDDDENEDDDAEDDDKDKETGTGTDDGKGGEA